MISAERCCRVNFQTMDYFVAIAEERSFTRAAGRLHVSQQTLSASIASVERELGVQLIERTIPLSLTYAGEKFLGYARRFQAQQRAMGQEFRDIAHNDRGRIRVGVTATRGHIIMPRAIAMFQRAHPHISIALVEGENDELVDELGEGRLDMVVATVAERVPGLVVHQLFNEAVVLIVAQSLLEELYGEEAEGVAETCEATGSIAGLASCPFLLMGERDVPGEFSRRMLAETGVSPEVRVVSKNSETLMALALRGVGACFVPSELVATTFADPAAAGMRVIRLGESMSYPLSVAWRSADHTWSAIIAFDQVLRQQFADGSRMS
ncbi:MAG: LysR family transcriptional regulator [Coriobacteriaceae bacterium]|nr:LysR family transcriptional regulator [Coriobacteriaceae bacterium]MCI7437737.1 LysR family transcriptional regulator [Coriobacteriaceae bacterium]MDD7583634.1 LysR family transcriptional regulator [Coriobacteriaceae bacterium]